MSPDIFGMISEKFSLPQIDLFCHQVEQSGTSLLFTKPQRPSSSSGCLFPSLEPRSPLRLPSLFPNPKGVNEDTTGRRQGNPDCSLLAKEFLVPDSPPDGERELLVPSTSLGLSHPEPDPSSSGLSAPSYSLDIEWKILRRKGLSGRVFATLCKAGSP